MEICDKYSLCWLAAVLRKRWISSVPRPVLVGLTCERMDDNLAAYATGIPAARRLARLYMRKVYVPLFDCHLANSHYVAQELFEASPDFAPERVRVCGMGADTEGLGPEHRSDEARNSLLERVGGNRNTVLLLYAGRLSPEKNVPLLIDVMDCLGRSCWSPAKALCAAGWNRKGDAA